jgi:hypothetical protein
MVASGVQVPRILRLGHLATTAPRMTCNCRKEREGVGGGVVDMAAEAALGAFRISKRGTNGSSSGYRGERGLLPVVVHFYYALLQSEYSPTS